MNRKSYGRALATACLLAVLWLPACATTVGTISQPSYVKFYVQIGAIPLGDPTHVLVSMQDATGNCVLTNALLSRLIDVLDHPDDPTNRTSWDQLYSCSSEWVLPQPAAERTRQYSVYGPHNGNFNAILIADDQSTPSSNTLVDNITIDALFPAGGVGSSVHANAAQATLRDGSNTVVSTARGTYGYLSFTPTILNLSATPPQGMGKFHFLAANMNDLTDNRLLIVVDGSFGIQPN